MPDMPDMPISQRWTWVELGWVGLGESVNILLFNFFLSTCYN